MKPQWAQHTRCKTSRPRDSRLRTSCTSSSGAQLVQQRLGVLQIGGVEAFGEPVVDLGDHRARLVAPIGVAHEPRETGRLTQLLRIVNGFDQPIRSGRSGERKNFAEFFYSWFSIGRTLIRYGCLSGKSANPKRNSPELMRKPGGYWNARSSLFSSGIETILPKCPGPHGTANGDCLRYKRGFVDPQLL